MNTSTASSNTALSTLAYEAGGALVRILSDPQEVARYANAALSDEQSYEIGDLVAEYGKLNTDGNVGSLIWLVSYHGVNVEDVEQLLEEYQPAYVYLAFEFLVEAGERTTAGTMYVGENEATFETVKSLVALLDIYHDSNYSNEREVRSPEQLSDLVTRLGGLPSIDEFHTIELLEDELMREE